MTETPTLVRCAACSSQRVRHRMSHLRWLACLALFSVAVGCGADPAVLPDDPGVPAVREDAAVSPDDPRNQSFDAGGAAPSDAGSTMFADAGFVPDEIDGGPDRGDAGMLVTDAGVSDSGASDTGIDAGIDASFDAGAVDVGAMDAGAGEVARDWRAGGELDHAVTENASRPVVAADREGNVIVAWLQSRGSSADVFARTYRAATGDWSLPTEIDGLPGSASDLDLVMHPDGHAMAVWVQSDHTSAEVRTRTYRSATGWGALLRASAGELRDADDPRVSIDASGGAVAVWTQYGEGHGEIFASHLSSPSHWDTPVRIGAVTGDHTTRPRVALGETGRAMAVWQHGNDIFGSRYTAGAGWSAAEAIEVNPLRALNPYVVVDSRGDWIVVWEQASASSDAIRLRRFDATSGWGTEEIIGSCIACYYPSLSVGAGDELFATWSGASAAPSQVYVTRTVLGDFQPARLVASDATGNGSRPAPSVEANAWGEAVLTWWQFDLVDGMSRRRIWGTYFLAGAWQTPILLGDDPRASGNHPRATIDANGAATVVWEQSDGTHLNVRQTRYE